MLHLEQETLELIQKTKAKRIKLIKTLEQDIAPKKKPKKQPKPQKKKAS